MQAINLNDKVYWFFLDLAMLQEEIGENDKYLLNLRKALDALNTELVYNRDKIQLYIDKFCIQRYLGSSNEISSVLSKLKELGDDKLNKNIKIIESVNSKRQIIAPYRCIFTWVMSPKCNYKCAYCSVRLFEKVNENIVNDKSVREIADSWKNIYEKYGSSRIRLTGGEPSIYPGFFSILKELTKYHRLQLGTNLSFDINKFCDVADPEKVRVDVSLHCEYVKLEDFVKKIELLKKNRFKVSVSYVAYPDFIKNISLAKREIENMDLPFFVHPFSGVYKGKVYPLSYTEEEKKQIFELDKKTNTELENRKRNNDTEEKFFNKDGTINWNGINKIHEVKKETYLNNKKENKYKMCRMGQMYAYVYPNGNVYRCCSSFNDNYLGNLFDKTVKLLENSEKCYDIDNCKCWRCMVPGEESRWLHTWLDDWEMEIWEKE
jgi:sulfatase maturation enzyme AslB (radical SAM superfamily)